MRYLTILLLLLLSFSGAQADLNPGDKVPNPTLIDQQDQETDLYSLLSTVTVLHLWKCNWPQCRAEMPHLREMMEEFKDLPVSFVSINTRNPKGQVDNEIKRFKMTQPIHYGRGQDINKDFQVKILPRLIFIKEDTTVHQDLLFMNLEDLRAEIQLLLSQSSSSQPDSVKSD